MEQEKNKNGVIILLVVLVIILAVLCVLFATGTISFKSNEVNNTKVNNTTDDNTANPNSNDNSNQIVRYYQYYVVLDNNSEHPTYTSREIELNADGSARWRFGGNGQGGDNYKGTYTEDSNKIVLTLEREMPNNTTCDVNNSVFPCTTTILFDKMNETTIVSYHELGNENASYDYKLVDKTELHHFN